MSLSHPLGRLGPMERQLRLLDALEQEWRLDDQTRAVGLAGVAVARQALRSARPVPVRADDAAPAAA